MKYKISFRTENGEEIVFIFKRIKDFYRDFQYKVYDGETVTLDMKSVGNFLVDNVLKAEIEFSNGDQDLGSRMKVYTRVKGIPIFTPKCRYPVTESIFEEDLFTPPP